MLGRIKNGDIGSSILLLVLDLHIGDIARIIKYDTYEVRLRVHSHHCWTRRNLALFGDSSPRLLSPIRTGSESKIGGAMPILVLTETTLENN